MNNERALMSYESVFNKINIDRSQELLFSGKKKEAKQPNYRPDFNTVKKLTNDAAKIFKEVLKSFNNPALVGMPRRVQSPRFPMVSDS